MVVLKVIAAGSSYGVKLMVGERMAELTAGSCKGVVETIVGIVHLIHSEHRFKATFIKTGIVGYEGDCGYLMSVVIYMLRIREEDFCNSFLQPLPDFRKHGGIVCIALRDAMNTLTEIAVIVRLWLYETVELIHYLTMTNHHHSHGATIKTELNVFTL